MSVGNVFLMKHWEHTHIYRGLIEEIAVLGLLCEKRTQLRERFCGASPPVCHSTENASPSRCRDKRRWVRSSQKLTPELFLKGHLLSKPGPAGLGSLCRLTSSAPAVPAARPAGLSHLREGWHRPVPLLPQRLSSEWSRRLNYSALPRWSGPPFQSRKPLLLSINFKASWQ